MRSRLSCLTILTLVLVACTGAPGGELIEVPDFRPAGGAR